MRRLYDRGDALLKNLSRGAYAVFLGASTGVGVLVAGLLVSRELLLVQALTVGLVMFGLECAFGLHQTTD
jgi:hypothetical protein